MFLETGEETATVDALHYQWNGRWPNNRSPRLEGAWLDNKTAEQNIHVKPGLSYKATAQVRDPDNDPLTYRWEVMEESTDLKTGGDLESKPKTYSDLIDQPNQSGIALKAPTRPGAYRLFVYAFDGRGHAAHANIPFFVDKSN